MQKPRAVTVPSAFETISFPALGSVPAQRPWFPDAEDLAQEGQELRSDLLKAQADKERLGATPMPETMTTQAPVLEEPVSTKPFSALLP